MSLRSGWHAVRRGLHCRWRNDACCGARPVRQRLALEFPDDDQVAKIRQAHADQSGSVPTGRLRFCAARVRTSTAVTAGGHPGALYIRVAIRTSCRNPRAPPGAPNTLVAMSVHKSRPAGRFDSNMLDMNLPCPATESAQPLPAALLGIVLLVAAVQGCSSQQAYGAGQAWQRQECNKINDTQERSRCMASASTSYQDYKRQAEAAKSGK
jgi:hypothetical protein